MGHNHLPQPQCPLPSIFTILVQSDFENIISNRLKKGRKILNPYTVGPSSHYFTQLLYQVPSLGQKFRVRTYVTCTIPEGTCGSPDVAGPQFVLAQSAQLMKRNDGSPTAFGDTYIEHPCNEQNANLRTAELVRDPMDQVTADMPCTGCSYTMHHHQIMLFSTAT